MGAVNLFSDLSTQLSDELYTTLLDADNVRIERIVSLGHASPEGFWYDKGQPGRAGRSVDEYAGVVEYLSVFGHAGFFCAWCSQQSLTTGVTIMSGKTDVVKGRLKEAAGALTGNDNLKAEGKTDQAIGKVKQIGEKAVDKIEQAVKKVRK